MDDRLERETNKQHLAYICYRDLGLARTAEGAYLVYIEKLGIAGNSKHSKPSSAFSGWFKSNDWIIRVRKYDRQQEESNRLAIYTADTEAFSSGIKRYRAEAESIAMNQLDAVRVVQDAIYLELARVTKKATTDEALDLSAMADICRVMKDVSAVAESASKRLNEAYSIKILLATVDGFFDN
jgi:hypothetical protein